MASDSAHGVSSVDHLAREDILRRLNKAVELQGGDNSCLAKISDSMVVKYGYEIRLCEARNMELAAKIPGVRVPKVYDAWEVSDSDKPERITGYIVMDFIPGGTVASMWPEMCLGRRQKIYEQLRESVEAIHGQGFVRPGPVGGGMSQGFYFTAYDAGPFETVHDMEMWFNTRQRVCKDLGYVREDEPDFSGMFNSLVFCHLDIHSQNLIIDPDDNLWVIDWSRAGGYPVFFEEAHLRVTPDDFLFGFLDFMSFMTHTEEVSRLRGIGYAVTTGWLLQPRTSDDVYTELRPPPSPKEAILL